MELEQKRTCFKCKEDKASGSFPRMKSGNLRTLCKDCFLARRRENARKQRDIAISLDPEGYRKKELERKLKYRESSKAYYAKRRAALKDDLVHKEKTREWQIRAYHRGDKRKAFARSAVRRAVLAGKLARPDKCSNCGLTGRIHGHHPDYSKPLEVLWVCQKCHVKIHDRYPQLTELSKQV